MKLGISTACFYPLKTELALKKCNEFNSDIYEVFFNSFSELETDFLSELKNSVSGEFISVHPFTSLIEPYFLFSVYKRRFDDTREFYKKYYAAAAYLGAKYVVLHGASLNGNITVEEYCERFNVMYNDALQYGVILCQENVNNFKGMNPGFIKKMSEILGDDVHYVFDLKQAIRAKTNPCDMLESMGKQIVHLHLSDNNSSNDCLLPFRGNYDFVSLIDYLSKNTLCETGVIEVYNNSYDNYFEIRDSYNKLKSFV